MRILFMGSGDIALPVVEWLASQEEHDLIGIVTQPDKPAGRKMELTPSPVKQLALRLGLPVLQPERVRRPEAAEQLLAMGADLIVVMAYGQIIPKGILHGPKYGCINLHASLLPRHRGAAPVQAAIEAGDAESGLTVIYMDEGLDTGDMMLKMPLQLERQETGGSLHRKLADLAPAAMAESLRLLKSGKPGAARFPV